MEYAFIKNEVVATILVCDGEFAEAYKAAQGYDSAVLRPANVGIGDLYHDGKFWRLETAADGTVSEVEL
jgi:hypothetical protein